MPELKNYQHELFCRAYIATYANATQSAIQAGYSVKSATKQGSRLSGRADIRARIAELAADAHAPGIESMEQARTMLYMTLMDLVQGSNSDMARVQAGRVLGDLLGMGEAGQRASVQLAKLEVERERLELQKEAIKAGETAKDVRISLDASLMDAIK